MFSAPKSIRLALVNKVQLRTSLGLKKSLRERAKIKKIFVAGGGGGQAWCLFNQYWSVIEGKGT